MSNANGPPPPDAQRGTYLKISSPGFSLELEGHPAFVMQSYDMVREDILRRLMDIMRAPPAPPPPAPPPPTLPMPEPPSGRALAPNFRETASPSARASNIRDVKARMANKQPTRPSSSPNTAPTPAPPSPPKDPQSAPLNTQASIQVELPPAPTSSATPTPSGDPIALKANRTHYVWIYISHQAYNKVYVADLDTLDRSPLRAFLDGPRLRKLYLEGVDLPAFKALLGEGRTLWTEPPHTR